MYTSGTTGRPKGAMLTHGNLLWNNINAALAFDTLEDDITLVCAPLFHIGGLNVTTLITLLKGGTVVLLRAFDPAKVLDLIEEHRITSMFGVPAMFLFMSQVPGFADRDLSSVRYVHLRRRTGARAAHPSLPGPRHTVRAGLRPHRDRAVRDAAARSRTRCARSAPPACRRCSPRCAWSTTAWTT